MANITCDFIERGRKAQTNKVIVNDKTRKIAEIWLRYRFGSMPIWVCEFIRNVNFSMKLCVRARERQFMLPERSRVQNVHRTDLKKKKYCRTRIAHMNSKVIMNDISGGRTPCMTIFTPCYMVAYAYANAGARARASIYTRALQLFRFVFYALRWLLWLSRFKRCKVHLPVM